MSLVLIFDYDGVIVDSLDLFMRFFINACKRYGHPEISSKEEFLDLFKGNMYENMMKLAMTKTEISLIVDQVKKRLISHIKELFPFPGMKEILMELTKEHILCITTSNKTSVVEKFLAYNKVSYFDTILGSDIHTSKIEKIKMIKKIHSSTSYVFIGDTIGDILEGKQANVITIGVTWGWHSKEELQKSKPDYLIDSVSQLRLISSLIKH
jgi:phosphoglycolate phosphatase